MRSKVTQFIQDCAVQIANEPDINDAIRATRTLGELLWQNHLGVFELIDIELALLARVINQLAPNSAPAVRREANPNSFLHVLTKAYATGGHTRVVESILKSDRLPNSAILISEKIAPALLERYQSQGWQCFAPLEHTSLMDAIQQQALIFEQYDVIVLYIHPYDIVSALAAGVARHRKGNRILFYNHADHNCNLGYGIADQVLEISYTGWTSRTMRGIEAKSTYVGIPIKLPETFPVRQTQAPRSNQHAIIASAGTAYKFKPSTELSFPQLIDDLLKNNEFRARIVGPNQWLNRWWWKAKFRLGQRLDLRPRLAYDAYLQLMQEVDAYVDSFPMTGGTAFTEIVTQGIPAFGLLSGSHGYSPTDQLKSKDIATLKARVLQYLADPKLGQVSDPSEMERIHDQIRDVHDIKNVTQRIFEAAQTKGMQIAPPWTNTVAVDVHFYAKIWDGRIGFAPIVHNWPDFRIVLRFLRLWLRLKFF